MNIQRQQITWPGLKVKKQGEGLPQHDRNTVMGDLYITVDVDFPEGQLSNEQRESKQVLLPLAISHLFSSSDWNIITSTIQTSLVQWFLIHLFLF